MRHRVPPSRASNFQLFTTSSAVEDNLFAFEKRVPGDTENKTKIIENWVTHLAHLALALALMTNRNHLVIFADRLDKNAEKA